MADLRVIGGELRGRKLGVPKRSPELRPTTGRTREAIFSILGPIDGLHVLDLFCGTGALAIEAVSRGASGAVAVDSDTRAATTNIEALGLSERVKLIRTDALQFLEQAPAKAFDLAFCDPPYRLADRPLNGMEPLLPRVIAPEGRIVIETAADRPMKIELPLITQRRYGDTLIRIHAGGEPA